MPCPSRRPSVRPARSHSLPVAPARPSAAPTSAGCEPILAFPLLPGPSTHPAWPSPASASARCEPVPVFPLLPGPSTCPAWPSAAFASARCEPISANRLTPASRDSGSGPGTMAAGAREQAASCDAFVLSRRLPAPDAPPSRTSPACLVAKPSPNHGPVLGRDCRCEFRQARSRAPLPDSVLAGGGMTDGVWQGGSVMGTPRRGSFRASRHDRGRRKTPRDPRCDRAETLAEPGIPATAAGILLRHHRNPLPRGWRRGGRRCSCSSSAARAETLSDRQEDLRRPSKKILRNSEQFPRHPETLRNSKKPSSPTENPPQPPKNRKKP